MTHKQYTHASHERAGLHKRLRHLMGDAIHDYSMIQNGDKVMVCVSGGKDSLTLLDLLVSIRRNAPVDFDIVAVNLDQKQPGFPADVLPRWFEGLGVDYKIVEQDTYSVVKRVIPEGQTTCALCSRLRRGVLYRVAGEIGATKIALGHHRDDILATFFLNLFHSGTVKSMPARLQSDDGKHTVIRPLAYCREKDILRYSKLAEFPIIPCNLCGSQPNLQRQAIAEMLRGWDKQFPGRLEVMFRAMSHIKPRFMLDRSLYDFASIPVPDGEYDPEGSDPLSFFQGVDGVNREESGLESGELGVGEMGRESGEDPLEIVE